MKLVFEDFDRINPVDVDQYAEAVRRANALVHNLNDVENYAGEKGWATLDVLETITVYGNDYADEFYLDFTRPVNPKGSVSDGHENYMYIEVLTAESAESNEREYMNDIRFTAEDRKNYKLGETIKWYLPLGDSGYWYTLK